MSYQSRIAGSRSVEDEFDLADFLAVAEAIGGGPVAQSGPRSRRRAARAKLAGAGAVAAMLAIEGCKTIAPEGPVIVPGEPEPNLSPPKTPTPAPPPEPVESYSVAENVSTQIPVNELLSGTPGAQSIVAVTGAEHGTAHLMGSVVHFTPAEGYSGPALISFTYKDSSGRTRSDSFEITVDDDKAPSHDTHDNPMPDHGDSHVDHGGEPGEGHDSGGDGGHGGGGDDSGEEAHGGHEPGGMGGATNDHASHMAAMMLAPPAEATHIAVNNGSWFDPATWANGEVPGDGAKVHIPEGVVVNYDGESAASLFTLRVDGELDFATDVDTFMEVDTFLVAMSGHVTMGTVDDPVAANVQTVISIADNGPIDVAWDPQLLSRGVISMGEFEIHGAEKDTFLRLAADPMKGDTTLTLEAPPEGWNVGDKLVLTGTHLTSPGDASHGEPRFDAATEDEELIITGVSGNVITVDRPLAYDHEGARADLKAYVANYTRNVRIESEGGEDLPVHERGHVMFMSDKVDLRYAEFTDLGRTDKSERAFDVAELDHVEADTNVKARYPVHLHRDGVSDGDDPIMVVGNAVWGSPGWGYVHHDSNAVFADNAAYDVFGAAFVAETGNETGRWSHNIAIKSLGVDVSPKDADDYHAFDLGRNGVGFWFQGRLVDAVDNVAAGMPGGDGFVYMHRIPDAYEIPVDPSNVLQGEKLRYLDENSISEPNIGQFIGNESLAVFKGLEVIKANARQHHDVRTVLEDFTAWEVWNGVSLQYTGHYTLKNLDLVATDQDVPKKNLSIGIWYLTDVVDAIVVDADIAGFNRGVLLRKDTLVDGVDDFQYVFIDVAMSGVDTHYVGLDAGDRVLSGDALMSRTVTYEADGGEIIFSGPDFRSDAPLILSGIKNDSLGEVALSNTWDPFKISFDSLKGAVEQNGYWTLDDGRKVTLIEEYVTDRTTGEISKFSVFVEVPSGLGMTPGSPWTAVRVIPDYNGVLDLDNAGPVARDDAAHVQAGKSIVLDLTANDSDPEGEHVSLDGITVARHGHVVENDNGTVTYFADPGYSGHDKFYYWAQDEMGNFTKAEVVITVDA